MPHMDLRPRTPQRLRSPLWHLNAALARPIAALFGLLGIAAGQLSLQSVTLTAVGLLRAAGGSRAEIVQGVLIVYAGLLFDRADDLLAQRGKGPSAWSRFLGAMADRLVEVALLVALAWLAVQAPTTWPVSPGMHLVAIVLVLGALFLARSASLTGDLVVLRLHLSSARRLPGPSAVPRVPQAQPWLARWFDRDAFVLTWALGVAAGWLQATTFVLLAMQLLVALETFVLVWSRRKDPEPHAADVLARGP